MNLPAPAKLEVYAIGAAALLVLGVVLYVVVRGFKGVTRDAVNVAGNAAAGVVVGIGDQVGLPDPASAESQDRCAQAMAEGHTLDVSLYCPASTFAKYLVTPRSSPRYGSSSVTPADTGGASGGW